MFDIITLRRLSCPRKSKGFSIRVLLVRNPNMHLNRTHKLVI